MKSFLKKFIKRYMKPIPWCYHRMLEFVGFVRFLQLLFKVAFVYRYRYDRKLSSIREKFLQHQKIKVLFLVNEQTKWKVQSLYDLFSEDASFEVEVGVTLAERDLWLSHDEMLKKVEQTVAFFTRRDIPTVMYCDAVNGRFYSLSLHNPDVVFYQQPWGIQYPQGPDFVSKFALTAYIPYFVQNYGSVDIDSRQPFHRMIWRMFLLNDQWAALYSKGINKFNYAGKILGLGHTMIDEFLPRNMMNNEKKTVIYAPHWSFVHPNNVNDENLGTFVENGIKMLEFAKSHPEINWVFKPHPILKLSLVNSGFMTSEVADAYYREWEQIGTTCYTGDYVQLFLNSTAMITDCGSFLVEYACTGHPLIHLISKATKIRAAEPSRRLFKSFYGVHDFDEFKDVFNRVVVEENDYKRVERLAEIETAGLKDRNAGKRIHKYFQDIFTGCIE